MIPLQVFDLTGIDQGTAILVVGLLGLLLWACVTFRNPLGLIMWGLSTLSFLVVGLYEVSDEVFWLSVMGTVILVIVGIIARWIR